MVAINEKAKMRKRPADLRYGKRDVELIAEQGRTMRLLLKRIDGALESARRMELKQLNLDGVTKGERALELLKGWAANVEHAVRRAEYGDL